MDVMSTVLSGKESKRLIRIPKIYVKGAESYWIALSRAVLFIEQISRSSNYSSFYVSKEKMLLKIEYSGLTWIK